MRQSIARYWRTFSIGFIAAFVAYLFIAWESDKVFTGVGISVVAGLVLVAALEYYRARRRRGPEVSEVQR
jgi:hypothetical protein